MKQKNISASHHPLVSIRSVWRSGYGVHVHPFVRFPNFCLTPLSETNGCGVCRKWQGCGAGKGEGKAQGADEQAGRAVGAGEFSVVSFAVLIVAYNHL